MANVNRQDPIRERYYSPLERAEFWGNLIFIFATGISIFLVTVSRESNIKLYNLLQMMLVVLAFVSFSIGVVARLYFFPRATQARAADQLSNSFGVPLAQHSTTGYYNNPLANGHSRLAATTLENCFFSMEIVKEMCLWTRVQALAAIVVFIFMLREDDLAFAAIAAATIFGEQIVVRCIRLEYFRSRCEMVYERLYSLFLNKPGDTIFNATAIEQFNVYESTKSVAAVTLSSRIFSKMNDALTIEWEARRRALNI
ncbi:hypothetical protein [Burkholderia sp. LMG 32019]|uniref:hypothetical protein n=1 Tax=Burkholderia sp. LMG 32019 TaxID=3158173 RepID=UPI003C2F740E